MKSLIFLLVSVLTPISFASAKSITIEVSGAFSYEDIKAFSDGSVAITGPKVYEYYMGAATRGIVDDNAMAACIQIGKKSFTYEVGDIKAQTRTVNFSLKADDSLSDPWFADGGKYSTLYIRKVLCK